MIHEDRPLVDERSVRSTLQILAHRGPDDEGVFCDGLGAVAHKRLSIIDLTSGHQPISNENGTVHIICNGEIYNFRDLREDLERRGHRFRTHSDSEVILHLYEDVGPDCLKQLRGIFSFAIYDTRDHSVLLARDQLGVKPLFYTCRNGVLVFASELKAICQTPGVSLDIDFESLYQYFTLNYIPSPLTAFRNILSLNAGHYLLFKAGVMRVEKYWDIVPEEPEYRDEKEWADIVRRQVEEAVTAQLVSDVPVGAFLSGGIDSSTVVCFMQKHLQRPVQTFNVRFADQSFDESQYARLTAKKLGTLHREVCCRPEDFVQYLSDVVQKADNLTADVSMIPLYLVSRLASEHVKVVLSGDGADELFAGYPTYSADTFLRRFQTLPALLKKQLIPSLAAKIPISDKKMNWGFKLRQFLRYADLPLDQAHASWRNIFSFDDKQKLLKDVVCGPEKDFWAYSRYYRQTNRWGELQRNLYADMKVWMVDSILAKVDTMSMAHSLEVRVPFLDLKLVELAAKIPPEMKLRGRTEKYILKKAMKDVLPHKIVNREKAGFQIPFGRWLKTDLKQFLLDILTEESVNKSGFLEWKTVQHIRDEHLSGRKDHSYQLLSLIHFQLWYDIFAYPAINRRNTSKKGLFVPGQ